MSNIIIKKSGMLSAMYYKLRPLAKPQLLKTFFSKGKVANDKRMVFCCDDFWAVGGLCDRLQGAMTFYKFCREYQIPFYISWTNPFVLSDFLEPSMVDWRCRLTMADYKMAVWRFVPMMMCRGGYLGYFNKQSRWFEKQMKHFPDKTMIVWGNARLVKKQECKQLWDELFRPTSIVQEQINKCLAAIGGDFVGITLRFQNLLGDFKENNSQPLCDEGKRDLMKKCKEKIMELHAVKRLDRVLVTSDSRTFLDYISDLNYIHTIPGRLVHMNSTDDRSLLTHAKSFVDLLTLSKARKIYLLVTGKMYRSGFAETASFIGNCDYEDLFF